MNIIFLDIDGVLNCQTFYADRKKNGTSLEYPLDQICPERIGWLNGLCKDTGSKVVISSSWKHIGLSLLKDLLERAGATFDIIDITPNLKHRGCVRGNEIHLWVEMNESRIGMLASNFNSYAIIDDDSDMLYSQRNNLFLTDYYSGLTPNTCYRIRRHFERMGAINKTVNNESK